MIKTILVATDGSKVATKSVRIAAELAKKLAASVSVLGVVDLSYLIAPGEAPVMTTARIVMEAKEILKQVAAESVDTAAETMKKSGLRVRKAVRTGRPSEEIIKEARKIKADLIVLGSHGKSALTAAVLGSVAYGVIHKDSNIPVLVVRK